MSINEFHPYNVDFDAGHRHSSIGLNREPIADSITMHQSQAFEIKVATNPLIAASAPLLTIATQLREQFTTPNLQELHAQLCNEIKAFENKARSLNYRSTIILAARYFLCALIDETILTTTWGENSLWHEKNLLKTFQRETWSGERFFLILERSLEDPKPHIDLLELGYLCLSLGYEGRYRHRTRGHYELGQLIDKIYYLIRDERGEFSKRLLIAPTTKSNPKKLHRKSLPIWVIPSIVIAGLVLSYIPYRVELSKLSTPISEILADMHSKNE